MSSPNLSWQSVVRPPLDGEPVKGSVAGRGHRDNEQRTAYLKAILDSIEAGQILALREQPLSSGTPLFSPVYLTSLGLWKVAKAEFLYPTQGLFELTPQSRVAGVLCYKDSDLVGSIAIAGALTLTADELSAIVDGSLGEGVYYLSSTEAGKITRTHSPQAVRVGQVIGPLNGTYRFIVSPAPLNEMEEHIHFHIPLNALPAGEPNCAPPWNGTPLGEEDPAGGPYPDFAHEVTVPDAAIAGWLPATAEYFPDVEIPASAKFGYNIEADANLKYVWPPVPAGYAYVALNGVGVMGTKVLVDDAGIWWLDNTFGHAPWSPNILTCEGSSSYASSTPYPDPDTFPCAIDLWFAKFTFGAPAYVQTLTPADASLKITDNAGGSAVTGDLKIRVATLTAGTDTVPGTAVKAINFPAGTITTGPVVSSIADSETITAVVTDGVATLTAVDPLASGDIDVKLVALNNVSEESGNDILRLRFPAGVTSSLRCVVETKNFSNATANLVLRFWFLATDAVNPTALSGLPLTLTKREVSSPEADAGTALPLSDDSLAWADLPTTALAAGTYIEAVSAPIVVEARDSVFFTLQLDSTSTQSIDLLRIIPSMTV